MSDEPTYKRGTIRKNGRLYGFNPDGTLYRIWEHRNTPFLQIVDISGSTFLRIRQANEEGYTDCPVFGVCDISYPTCTLRRARTGGGGKLAKALTCCPHLVTFVEMYNKPKIWIEYD